MGGIVGALLAALVVVIVELMDTTINSEEYLTVVYKNYPLLAVVPGAESSKSNYRGYYKGNYESRTKGKEEPADKKTGGAK